MKPLQNPAVAAPVLLLMVFAGVIYWLAGIMGGVNPVWSQPQPIAREIVADIRANPDDWSFYGRDNASRPPKVYNDNLPSQVQGISIWSPSMGLTAVCTGQGTTCIYSDVKLNLGSRWMIHQEVKGRLRAAEADASARQEARVIADLRK